MIGVLGADPGMRYACSRSGCEAEAQWALRWRNPKIHDEHRRKIWLACAEHRGYLTEFLAARDFPLEVLPLSELDEHAPGAGR